ncbi:MAG: histidine triad nucleotide-binding protein [bacterium]|jgi:histidine triad (HIT) family protein|nr:histidine triad nucleotide-binding protein [bacterium]
MNATQKDDCIFCKIVSREFPSRDNPTPLVYEDEHIVAFHDINPQAPVHLLVIPRKHIAKIGEISEEDSAILLQLVQAVNHMAKETGMFEDGYRIVINSGDNGGQTVYHLHAHVLGGRFMRWPPG